MEDDVMEPTGTEPTGTEPDTDSLTRCDWSKGSPDYIVYHDQEWGMPTVTNGILDDQVLFEKLCLEGFQSGLSWLTILRKRPAFREVFANFEAETVASYTDSDIERLLTDARIIRHRGKIEATINNAQAVLHMFDQGETLSQLMWSHRPPQHSPRKTFSDVPATTPESIALAKALKSRGFKFVGPTTAYAAMQAMGVVNDHLTSCFSYDACRGAQKQAQMLAK